MTRGMTNDAVMEVTQGSWLDRLRGGCVHLSRWLWEALGPKKTDCATLGTLNGGDQWESKVQSCNCKAPESIWRCNGGKDQCWMD